jgi:transposase
MSMRKGSTKLNEVSEPFIKLMRSGVFIKHACKAVGIDHSTYYDWMRKGEKETEGAYRDFYLGVKKARAESIARNVALVQKAAAKNWRAAAWWLERSCPKEFGKREVEVNVNQNVSRMQVNLDKLANSPELLEKANELSRELNKLYEEEKG